MSRSNQKRDILLLAGCQALFMSSTAAIMTYAAIVGKMLATYEGYSTWPIAFQFASMMATTYLASQFMKRVGRRIGFVTGSLIGMVGGLIATYAIFAQNFWIFCAGFALIGSFNAFSHYFRFAAAEVSTADFRSRAISYVLAGGVIAAVVGPNLAGATRDLFAPVLFAGIFVAILGLYVAIITIVMFVDFPPVTDAERRQAGRPLMQIISQPKCVVAILGGVIGYLVMSFLMTITPLAMEECGLDSDYIPIVISGHIIGMYLPSFFTGHLIARFGVTRIMLVGAALQIICVAINIAGIELSNFLISMFLVGVGWNFLFIGGTTLLVECYEPSERAKTQGFNDLCIWASVTAGAVVSGTAIHELGWTIVNYGVIPLILVTLFSLLWLRLSEEKRVPSPGVS